MSEAKVRRLTYFKALKKAKKDHWKEFLPKVGAQDVWPAKPLLAGRQADRFASFPDATTTTEINYALLSHFFANKDPTPTPSILRPFKEVSPLSPEEICNAL